MNRKSIVPNKWNYDVYAEQRKKTAQNHIFICRERRDIATSIRKSSYSLKSVASVFTRDIVTRKQCRFSRRRIFISMEVTWENGEQQKKKMDSKECETEGNTNDTNNNNNNRITLALLANNIVLRNCTWEESIWYVESRFIRLEYKKCPYRHHHYHQHHHQIHIKTPLNFILYATLDKGQPKPKYTRSHIQYGLTQGLNARRG